MREAAMTLRERFTEDEWTLVLHAPFDAFFFAAMADNKLEDDEINAFTETFARAGDLVDPLHREIALDYAIAGNDRVGEEMRFQRAENTDEMMTRMTRTKTVLQEKLTESEYQGFVKSLFSNAVVIAGASKDKKHVWSKAEPINEKEAMALTVLAKIWEVDLSALVK
jgi:hypothetical protein